MSLDAEPIKKLHYVESDFSHYRKIACGGFGILYEVDYKGDDPLILRYCDPNGKQDLSNRELAFNQRMGIGQGFDANDRILMRLLSCNNSPQPKRRCMNLEEFSLRITANDLKEDNPELQSLYNNYPELYLAKLIQELGQAIDEVHALGMKHLDYASRNIMVIKDALGNMDNLTLKAVDGGMAYLLDEHVPDNELSQWHRSGRDIDPNNKNKYDKYSDLVAMRVAALSILAMSTDVYEVADVMTLQLDLLKLNFTDALELRQQHGDKSELNRYIHRIRTIYEDPDFVNLPKTKAFFGLLEVLDSYQEFLISLTPAPHKLNNLSLIMLNLLSVA